MKSERLKAIFRGVWGFDVFCLGQGGDAGRGDARRHKSKGITNHRPGDAYDKRSIRHR